MGFDKREVDRILDEQAKLGARSACRISALRMPWWIDVHGRSGRWTISAGRFRERGMLPGLSTHMPETVTYADESGLDIETYIQLYNSMGFLMQVEVDWVLNIIKSAKKPVMTIKPMAADSCARFRGLRLCGTRSGRKIW